MGDIADMILDGVLCQACGDFINCDHLSFCRSCRPAKKKKSKDAGGAPVGKKGLKWLEACRRLTDNPDGMYPGEHYALAPAIFQKLLARGMVEEYRPHNPVHALRVVITEKGRRALANAEKEKMV